MTSTAEEEDFCLAVDYVQNLPPKGDKKLGNKEKLKFYALYKYAVKGPCTHKAPSRLKVVEYAKWNSWKNLGSSMNQSDARKRYLQEIEKLNPSWRSEVNSSGSNRRSKL